MGIDPSLEGRRVQLRDGRVARVTNGVLVAEGAPGSTPAAPRGRGSGSPVPREDAPALTEMRRNGEAGATVERTYQRVGEANRRLQPGPWRGTFLDAAIPTEQDSLLGMIGGVTLGPIARMTGAITPQEVEDYQTVQRARNQGVLAEQLGQRGVQTESDAARMAMAGLNVRNTTDSNETVIREGTQDAIRAQARSTFYTTWASRYGGLNARNEQGATVDEVWNTHQPRIVNQFTRMRGVNAGGQRAGGTRPPVIRRIR